MWISTKRFKELVSEIYLMKGRLFSIDLNQHRYEVDVEATRKAILSLRSEIAKLKYINELKKQDKQNVGN